MKICFSEERESGPRESSAGSLEKGRIGNEISCLKLTKCLRSISAWRNFINSITLPSMASFVSQEEDVQLTEPYVTQINLLLSLDTLLRWKYHRTNRIISLLTNAIFSPTRFDWLEGPNTGLWAEPQKFIQVKSKLDLQARLFESREPQAEP